MTILEETEPPQSITRRRVADDVPLDQKLMLTVDEAAALLGIGRKIMYDLLLRRDPITRKPQIVSILMGKNTRRIPRRALDLYIQNVLEVEL